MSQSSSSVPEQQNQEQEQEHVENNKKQSKSMMGYFWAAREYITPTLTSSQFLQKGLLTPEEFIKAGDELTFRCPTWTWEYCRTDSTKNKSYLPSTKQYLITKNVPCQTRVAFYEAQCNNTNTTGKHHNPNSFDVMDDDGEWLVSNMIDSNDLLEQQRSKHHREDTITEVGSDDEFDIIDEDGEVIITKPTTNIQNEQEQFETGGIAVDEKEHAAASVPVNDYADMDEYDDDNVYMDDDAAASTGFGTSSSSKRKIGDNDHIMKVRTYDLSITYDKYYQTPRIWMNGKNEYNQQYLTGNEMLQDVISDYANRTVTIEQHPYILGPHASIHPCKHGAVMKTIISNLIYATNEKNKTFINNNNDEAATAATAPISVEMYLFIFLKFVSSIIPTINYDFTMDVSANVVQQKKK